MTATFPPSVTSDLAGWNLAWFRLLPTGQAGDELDALRAEVAAQAREMFASSPPSAHPTAAAIRRLFRAAGTDPTRYRPSSEALLRRLLKGDPLPAIHPLVDLNNLLSIRLIVPCCVVDAARVSPPFTLRAGEDNEVMLSMRGEFSLTGRPLLEDDEGPFGTPITDAERVKLTGETSEVWLVAYLPESVTIEPARDTLRELLAAAPVAELTGHS